MANEGLRERKKRERRAAISEVAMGLFAQRGFDNVTVAEIARAADVAEQTVFNYFAAKEDLVFDEDAEMTARMIASVREREPGLSIVAGYRRGMTDYWLDRMENAPFLPMVGMQQIVEGSATLRQRAQALFFRNAAVLTHAIAEEVGADADAAEAWALAGALLATQYSLFQVVPRRLKAGDDRAQVLADVRAALDAAFARLERAFGDYPGTG